MFTLVTRAVRSSSSFSPLRTSRYGPVRHVPVPCGEFSSRWASSSKAPAGISPIAARAALPALGLRIRLARLRRPQQPDQRQRQNRQLTHPVQLIQRAAVQVLARPQKNSRLPFVFTPQTSLTPQRGGNRRL